MKEKFDLKNTVNKICPNCYKNVKGHPNKKFCCQKCKDRYHNKHNPRGWGLLTVNTDDDF